MLHKPIKSTFGWLGVLWVFLGSSLVLPWSLTRGGLGRCKGREILIKVLFWGKVPEYNSGIIDKECICESRCCERRAQYGLGRRNMLKHANGVSELVLFYVLRSLLRVGTLRAQYSKCHPRHFFISPTRKRPLKKLYTGITKNTLNNNTRMCMRVLS